MVSSNLFSISSVLLPMLFISLLYSAISDWKRDLIFPTNSLRSLLVTRSLSLSDLRSSITSLSESELPHGVGTVDPPARTLPAL
ncbi:hypothetical protein FKM82_028209 [Ascaphus truei]